MRDLTSLIPNVALAMSMLATLVVVFVTVWRALAASFSRKTAAVLALGVTIVAVVGTTQIILGPAQTPQSAGTLYGKGSAVLLLPFLSLAVAVLLSQLLLATARAPLQGRARSVMQKIDNTEAQAEPAEGKVGNTTPKPPGKPKKAQLPDLKAQILAGHMAASTATSRGKQS
jgi:hypothetical protein